jgi:EAL domain-containing protein (putative c-di-GMP-specific phosphodiesterase class I)/GGDEF domain-containing protein
MTIAALELEVDRLRADKHRLERDIEHLQRHDPLTGLLNRNAFLSSIHQWVVDHVELTPSGVMIELGFKGVPRIAGSLGRHAADYALSSLAARINMLQSDEQQIGRIDYWNFAVFMPHETDPLTALTKAKSFIDLLQEPLDWIDRKIKLEVFAGVALCTSDTTDAGVLLEHAGLALKSASERGGPGYNFFNPKLAEAARRKQDVQSYVSEGLDKGWFQLQYQPIFNCETAEIASFEALMRLHHPEFGLISPVEFIPVAEEFGMITRLGAWALVEACKQAAQWPGHVTVAVNISPEQFYSGTLLTDVHHALVLSSYPAYRLELEVTESTMLKDSEVVLQQLNALRELGCSINLDDFGTGYSSLSYLWKFPFSKLKIDKSFVQAADHNPTVRGMLRSIIDLSRNVGLKTTAEGIETEEQADIMRAHGCDFLQGYLTGKPQDAAHVPAVILKQFAAQLRKSAGSASEPIETKSALG